MDGMVAGDPASMGTGRIVAATVSTTVAQDLSVPAALPETPRIVGR